jgi:NAD(P)-dependent dehydrogenase (short-subunit alcohol dehydrogenase family)
LATPVTVDMTDPQSVALMVTEALQLHGRIDALINCVGVCDVFARLIDLDPREFDRIVSVNLHSAFLGIRSVVPPMLAAGGGSIVNFASVGGIAATEGIGAYGASKAAVIMLTKTAALEYGIGGVRVNAVCPGPTRTPMFESVPEPTVREIERSMALGRIGEPSEVAEAAIFLASPSASFITGVALAVDGGRLVSADTRPEPPAQH